ncbi:hypothetical protein [Neisseria sp. Ec49-e6-T10]|uniref:hypothetical protein n=1 Tax=Neisseria sp. Ec49-e6-T10 TaxID=3140744 RepID=UPI003EBE6CCB
MNKENSNYHRLITSGVMFNSIKGKQFSIAISMKSKDFDKYLRNTPTNPPITGKVIIHSAQGVPQIHSLVFTPDFLGETEFTSYEPWKELTSKILVDEKTKKPIVLKRGQYIIIPELYIPKSAPNNILTIIKIMELDQFE